MTDRLHSAGGVTLALPDDWTEIVAGDHLAAFVAPVAPEPDAQVMTPTCIVNDQAGHLDLVAWWTTVQAMVDAPILLDASAHDDGFSATYAMVAGSLSCTGTARIRWLPGRSLVVTTAFDSDRTHEFLPVARAIGASVEVEGLP